MVSADSTLKLSHECEEILERAFGPDLRLAAIEQLTIAGYQTGKLSMGEVALILGLPTSFEAQVWLARRGVPLNYTLEDLESDRATIAKLFPDKTS